MDDLRAFSNRNSLINLNENDRIDPAINVIEPAINGIEPTSNVIEAAINGIEPLSNGIEPTNEDSNQAKDQSIADENNNYIRFSTRKPKPIEFLGVH